MGPVSFLIIAVVVGVIGVMLLVSMNRAPRRPDHAMEEFRREMQALAPPRNQAEPRSTTSPEGRAARQQDVPGTPQIKRVGPVAAPEED